MSRKLKIVGPREVAGGMASVVSALRYVLTRAGPARGVHALRKANQRDGFDCPGCAWPDPGKRSFIELCETGARAVADDATSARVTAQFFARHSVAELRTKDDRWLNAQGRLTEPMVLRSGEEHYSPISWEEALEMIAGQLKILQSPDEAVFYTSGHTGNEAAFLFQLLARRLGTNNLPGCANLCDEPTGRALMSAIGHGKGTVTLDDFDQADTIFIAGLNPGTSHPRMLATLQRAGRRGAHIISVNPLDETGLRRYRNPRQLSGYAGRSTLLADLHLPVRINGDAALFQAIAKALLELERRVSATVLDHDFVAGNTVGFEQFKAHILDTSWGALTRQSGVDIERIRAAAEMLAESRNVIFCWGTGLTQHRNGVANIREFINLALMRGHIGRAGNGLCPVRVHSNVQGQRMMGIREKPDRSFLASLQSEFHFEPPEKPGLDTVGSIRAMRAGQVKVFVALGGNFVAAAPDSDTTSRAMARCRLSVQISTRLNRSHLHTGRVALILPALGRSEKDGQDGTGQFMTVEDSMGTVRLSRGVLQPVSAGLRSETRIVGELGRQLFGDAESINWTALAVDNEHVRERIARVVPGFENFSDRLQERGEFVLPHPVRDELRFPTEAGKAHFSVRVVDELEVEEDQFLLTSIRSHDQFDTTVYSCNDRYRGIYGSRRIVLANEADLFEHGLSDGMMVDITSHCGDQARTISGFRLVTYDIPRGCLAAYYPEINPLVPLDHVAELSNTPACKSLVVSLKMTSI